MSIISVIFIAVGLAADAFAVSVTAGVTVKRHKVRQALKMAVFFGAFQAIMPVAGWFSGISLRDFISGFDHWFAFVLLTVIGGKMIYESTIMKASNKEFELDIFTLFMLAIATSIDALAVGFSLSLLKVSIIVPSVIIGIITFVLSLAGFFIGNKMGHFLENKIEFAGGLILIAIGIKILLEHFLG